jgi:PIN domain nuclease of toxin-antitoxin system
LTESLLLDTHIWIWLLSGNHERVARNARRAIEDALSRRAVAVSDISYWEVATKAARGRLELAPSTDEWLSRAQRAPGIGTIRLDRDILLRSVKLQLPHGDPADRMLVATALTYDLRLVTADTVLLDASPRARGLALLDARP